MTSRQKEILQFALHFRFVTAPMLTRKFELKSRQSMVTTLNRLVESGHLAVRKANNKDFSNRGYSYHITTKGYKAMTNNLEERILKAIYRNKTVSKSFVDHSTDIFRVYVYLKKIRPYLTKYYTKVSMKYAFDDEELLPSPSPDLIGMPDNVGRYTFIEAVHDEHLFIAKKKFRNYLDFFEDNWYLEERADVMFILSKKSEENNLLRYIKTRLEDAYIDGHTFLTTTMDKILDEDSLSIFSTISTDDPESIVRNVDLTSIGSLKTR